MKKRNIIKILLLTVLFTGVIALTACHDNRVEEYKDYCEATTNGYNCD